MCRSSPLRDLAPYSTGTCGGSKEEVGLQVLVSGRELKGRGSRYSSSDMSPGGGVYFI